MTRTVQTLLVDAQQALASAGLSGLDWTQADIVSARTTRGGTVVGELGWRSSRVHFACRERSVGRLLREHGARWEPGLSGLFAIRLVIHRRFGFQAEVFDVLPESLGQAANAAAVAELAARIRQEDWAAHQRSLPDPGVPPRLAVVSAPTTQGLADFLGTARELCEVEVVAAPMAGQRAARAIAVGLEKAAEEGDVVVILRGGGPASTMEWANDEQLVRAIASCPKPVWVAVGHVTDRHLIDDVAHASFATPSQAAAELRRRRDNRTAAEREAELARQRGEAIERAENEQEAARRHRTMARLATVAAAALLVLLILLITAGRLPWAS